MAPQGTQGTLNARSQQAARGREPARDRRNRRVRLAALGLVLALIAIGIWGYRSLRRKGTSPDDLWAQAQADLSAGRYDRVEEAVARLTRLREPTQRDWFLRAQLAVVRNRPEEALADAARVSDDPEMAASARLLAGQVELRRDRLRSAERMLRAAIGIDPALVQPHRELIYIYGLQLRRAELNSEFLACSTLKELTFQEAYHWCMLRTESWNPYAAALILAKCVAADPGDRWSRLALAENNRRMGLLDEAESALTGLGADDREALAARARIAFDRQEDERAERLLAAGPADDPALALMRGRLALARRDSAAALHHFRIAYAADPDRRETLSGLIAALLRTGDEKAATDLREIAAKREQLGSLTQRAAMDGAEHDPVLPRELGAACAAVHRNPEARAWYKLAIARNPLDSDSQQALFRLRDDTSPNRREPRTDR
jgi:predicted Zn-dependent protease